MSLDVATFDGSTFNQARDGERLAAQHERVKAFMSDGVFRTLAEIREATGFPEASISARLRDFRKERFGSHGVDRRFVRRGLWAYRLVLNRRDLFE